LFAGLRELGYVEGRNLIVERRYAQGNAERFKEFAVEMVRLNVDAIIVVTTPAAMAARARVGIGASCWFEEPALRLSHESDSTLSCRHTRQLYRHCLKCCRSVSSSSLTFSKSPCRKHLTPSHNK
jgi:hypothetical protein